MEKRKTPAKSVPELTVCSYFQPSARKRSDDVDGEDKKEDAAEKCTVCLCEYEENEDVR